MRTTATKTRAIARRLRRVMRSKGGRDAVPDEVLFDEDQRAVQIGCGLRIVGGELPPGHPEDDALMAHVRANLARLLAGAYPLGLYVLDVSIMGGLIPRSLREQFDEAFRELAAEGGMIEGPDETGEGNDLCAVCNGPLIILGDGERVRHLQCRVCGAHQEKERPTPTEYDASCPTCFGPPTVAGRGVMTDRLCDDPCHRDKDAPSH